MNSISLASSSFLSLAFDGRYNNYSGIRLHLIAIFGCFDTKYINFIPFVSHCPDLFLVFARSIIHVNEISYVCIRAMCGSTSVILIKKTLNSSVSVSLCVFEWSMCMVKNANKHHINRLVFSKSLIKSFEWMILICRKILFGSSKIVAYPHAIRSNQ